jgi:hypothetical protein
MRRYVNTIDNFKTEVGTYIASGLGNQPNGIIDQNGLQDKNVDIHNKITQVTELHTGLISWRDQLQEKCKTPSKRDTGETANNCSLKLGVCRDAIHVLASVLKYYGIPTKTPTAGGKRNTIRDRRKDNKSHKLRKKKHNYTKRGNKYRSR